MSFQEDEGHDWDSYDIARREYESEKNKGVQNMEVTIIKTAENGDITKEQQTITGVPRADLKVDEKWREFTGALIEREEKQINLKDGKKLTQFIYRDAQDERGAQLVMETFSPTDDGVIAKLMEDTKKDIHLFYEVHTDNFGTKFRIKAVELPDGTWTAPKAKEAWRKGNAVNNRALAMQASAYLFMGAMIAGDDAANEKVLADVIKTADKLYEWIKAE